MDVSYSVPNFLEKEMVRRGSKEKEAMSHAAVRKRLSSKWFFNLS